jgi:hypothetical protein
MRKDDRCTLDPGLTALALRGLSAPSAYPFIERHLWRKRAVGLFGSHEAQAAGPRKPKLVGERKRLTAT